MTAVSPDHPVLAQQLLELRLVEQFFPNQQLAEQDLFPVGGQFFVPVEQIIELAVGDEPL